MRKRGGSSADKPSKDREDSWKTIFKGLLDVIRDQQRQLESLVKERKYLQKRIQSQHDRWAFNVKLLEDQISQVMRDSKIKDMARFVEASKANLIICMKQKEAIMHKLKFEDVDSDRADLKLVFDELSKCLAERKRVTRGNSNDVDVSALKAERDFAWNQYKKADTKLQEQVKRTNDEVEKLVSDLEESKTSNMEKNTIILALQDDIGKLESDSRKKSEEISRLANELELLRSKSITPVLRRCVVESGHGDKNNGLDHSRVSEKGRTSLKRKASQNDSNVKKPRLFSSNFKVPKLKG